MDESTRRLPDPNTLDDEEGATRRFADPAPSPTGPPTSCPRCHGPITTAGVEGGSHRVNLIQRGAGQFIAPRSDLLAYVCTLCGYTEFYAVDLRELRPNNRGG